MTEKEFNLSSKKEWLGMSYYYPERDVKEFIKKETKLIQLWMRNKITAKEFWEQRRKLAGEKLI